MEFAETIALITSNAEAKARELDNVGDKLLITSAFKKEWIDQMISEPYWIKQNVPHIFITIDPSVGKDRNYYALLSAIFIKGECIILGGECINCCVSAIVASHIKACRSYSCYLENALAVIIPESNLPFASTEIVNRMKDLPIDNYLFIGDDSIEDQIDLLGSITTRKKKLEMLHILIEEYMKKENIRFNANFIVSQDEHSCVDDVCGKVIDQLRTFCKKQKLRRDLDGSNIYEIVYTSKPPHGSNDVFVLALLMLVYRHKKFFDNPNNVKYWTGMSS